MLKVATILLSLLIAVAVSFGQPLAGFFDNADTFLKTYVHDGRVDYQALKKNDEALRNLIRQVESFDLEDANKDLEMAFWLNAYNLLVMQAVIARYPLQSPMDVKGFFDTVRHTVAGEKLTLNEIENIKLRQKYQDARIHFALVCAALSCPPIIAEAYYPTKVQTQLDARVSDNLNDRTFVRVDPKEKKVLLSEIFRWYESDFTAGGKTILDYINQFRAEKIPEDYEVGYYPYDWRLNRVAR